jgi:NAD(P)-dependent dehydrogenase (short-subunit alcohol dehydrogenase family)
VHASGPNCTRDVRIPDKNEMDVQNKDQLISYISTYGPFDEIIYGAAVNYLEWVRDIGRTRLIGHTFDVNVVSFVETVSFHHILFGHYPKRIVAISSDAARTAMRGSLAYGASKAALNAAIKNMARELAPQTVVVGVAPGMVADTPMTNYIDAEIPIHRGWTVEYAREYEKGLIPMQRRITKQEVAETIHFALTGPDMLSGSILEITGGK